MDWDDETGYVIDRTFKKRNEKMNDNFGRLKQEVLEANRFYVGSRQALNSNWGHATVEEAIEHAGRISEANNTDQFIVQIVKVVRRPKPNVVVEDMK